jgi:hypothetical protein
LLKGDHGSKYYNIEFTSPPTSGRLADIKFHLVDALGVSALYFRTPNGEDILAPINVLDGEVEVSYASCPNVTEVTFYRVYPATADYKVDHERGDFWTHYFIMRFFLAQQDVNNLYATSDVDGEYIGRIIRIDDVEALFDHYIKHGNFRYNIKKAVGSEPCPTHPGCWYNKPLVRKPGGGESLYFVCGAERCVMPPVNISGKAAEEFLKTGKLPLKYRKVESDAGVYWEAFNKSNLAFFQMGRR